MCVCTHTHRCLGAQRFLGGLKDFSPQPFLKPRVPKGNSFPVCFYIPVRGEKGARRHSHSFTKNFQNAEKYSASLATLQFQILVGLAAGSSGSTFPTSPDPGVPLLQLEEEEGQCPGLTQLEHRFSAGPVPKSPPPQSSVRRGL